MIHNDQARELLADSFDTPNGSFAQLIRQGDFTGIKIDPETALRARQIVG